MRISCFGKIKISYYRFYIIVLTIMPIIDSLNGIFNNTIPIGPVYRICFFVFLFFLLLKKRASLAAMWVMAFFVFLLCQIMVSSSYYEKSIQDTIKLFTPILMLEGMRVLRKTDKIEGVELFCVLDLWAILYPLLIIIPGILGLGTSAYDGSVGWKGWFYSLNEISFIMSCLVIFSVIRLKDTKNIKYAFLFLLNSLTIVLMGTKTGYATVSLFLCIYMIGFFYEKKQKYVLYNITFVFLGLIACVLLYNKFSNLIIEIFNRWNYQSEQLSHSAIDFLTSHRLRRFNYGWTEYTENGINTILFGWGFGGELAGKTNMEMDFIDLLFRTGVIGFVYIVVFYMKSVYKCCKERFINLISILWVSALVFGAGHVLFYGQSGMMLALIIMFLFFQSDELKEREENVKINGIHSYI